MNNHEFTIYCGQFAVIVFGFIFLEKRFRFLPINLTQALVLLVASILLSALTARLAELDSRKYLKDAILLMSFLEKDPALYGLFFLSGGNSIYPQSYYPMLIASNTWSNYTSFTIEKFYLLFSIISKPNLYNVSLFFGLISFISKCLLLKILFNLDKNQFKLNLLYLFLLIGGAEVVFVSGIYKENLLFFFICFLIYTVYSPLRKWKFIVAFFCFLHAFFLRLDTMVMILIVCFGVYLFDKYKSYRFWRFVFTSKFISISFMVLYLSSYRTYAVNKWIRYTKLRPGNTNFDSIDWSSDIWSLVLQILWRWRQAFYSTHVSSFSLIVLNILEWALWGFIGYLIYKQSSMWHRLSLFTTSVFVSFVLIFSLVVPNYVAIIRYRSPLLVLLVFGLTLNINKKAI